MAGDKNFSIKLRSISIKNYKGIDSFSIDFPMPTLFEDPDILVMGSENGLGKTSIIECSALLLMCLSIRENQFNLRDTIWDFQALVSPTRQEGYFNINTVNHEDAAVFPL